MSLSRYHITLVIISIFFLTSHTYSQKVKLKSDTEYTLQINDNRYHKIIFKKDKYEYYIYNKNRSSKALQMVNGQIRHVLNELVLFYPNGKVYKKMKITREGVIVDKVFFIKKREYIPE